MMIANDGGGTGLFLSPVPEPPGDPAALSRGAATYTAAHGELERDRATLSSTAGQATGTTWRGAGAAGFVAAAEELASAYALTSSALAQGATALRGYAADLAAAKETARRANAAIGEANSLASALLTAQSAAEGAQSAADGASQAATSAQAQAAAAPHSPTAQVAADSARSAANEAASAAQEAWNRVTTLSGQYEAARSHALTLAGEARTQASLAASKASAGFEAAVANLFGVNPRPARGGAHGVPGGGLTWPQVVSNLAKWNDRAGWALNSWGAFGAFVTGRKELGYLDASSTLRSAYEAEDEAFWKFYSREGSYFDWAPKMAAYNAAADGAKGAFKDLRESITPGEGVMGVVGRFGLAAGIGSDIVTEISPNKSFGPDGLLGGNTDRVMAGLNIGASGLALGDSFGIGAASAAMAIPGVDVVVGGVLVGTAVYAGGEFVYQHWHGIEHGISSAASWVGHELGL
jgi:hypothetical protein